MRILKQTALLFFLATMMLACSSEAPETTEETAEENTSAEETPQEAPKPELVGYKVGDIAEDFKLKNVDGKMLGMADYPEKAGFIIVFTCNHCPYSIAYEDRLNALHEKYNEQGYPVIAINPNDPEVVPEDSFEEMVKRAEEKSFKFPYLFDEGQQIYPKYGATKTPHVFVIRKTESGNKVAYIGAIDDNKEAADVQEKFLENALDAILKGEEPNPNFTKAFGCSVKCKKEGEKKI